MDSMRKKWRGGFCCCCCCYSRSSFKRIQQEAKRRLGFFPTRKRDLSMYTTGICLFLPLPSWETGKRVYKKRGEKKTRKIQVRIPAGSRPISLPLGQHIRHSSIQLFCPLFLKEKKNDQQLVEIFSKMQFFWAELVCMPNSFLKWARKKITKKTRFVTRSAINWTDTITTALLEKVFKSR